MKPYGGLCDAIGGETHQVAAEIVGCEFFPRGKLFSGGAEAAKGVPVVCEGVWGNITLDFQMLKKTDGERIVWRRGACRGIRRGRALIHTEKMPLFWRNATPDLHAAGGVLQRKGRNRLRRLPLGF